jgi:hypothetical protein
MLPSCSIWIHLDPTLLLGAAVAAAAAACRPVASLARCFQGRAAGSSGSPMRRHWQTARSPETAMTWRQHQPSGDQSIMKLADESA